MNIKFTVIKYGILIGLGIGIVFIIVKAFLNIKKPSSTESIVHDIETLIQVTNEKIETIKQEQKTSKEVIKDIKKNADKNDTNGQRFFKEDLD